MVEICFLVILIVLLAREMGEGINKLSERPVEDLPTDRPVNSAPHDVAEMFRTKNYLAQLYARGENLALIGAAEVEAQSAVNVPEPGSWRPEEKGESDPPPFFVYEEQGQRRVARKGTAMYKTILEAL